MLKHIAAGFVAALGFALATSAGADTFESAHAPGMCLSVAAGGAVIQPCDGGSSQDLIIAPDSGGDLIWAGLRCLRMAGQNNMPVLVTCAVDDNGQATRFNIVNNGPIRGDGLCLDVQGGRKNAGTRVIGFACNDQNNQRWLRTVTGKTLDESVGDLSNSVQEGVLSAGHAPHLCLNVQDDRLNLAPCEAAPHFTLSAGVPTTFVAADFAGRAKCLVADGTQGQQIQAASCSGTAISGWTFTSNGALRSANGLCADVEGRSQKPGARVIFFKCSGNPNQRFTLVP